MRYRMLYAALLVGLAACASDDTRWNRFRETEPQLAEARELASIDCTGREECTTRWERTREYVEHYSATRIRHADEDGIETARPFQAGVVYLWATRAPTGTNGSEAEHARISLKGMCRGMYSMDGGPGLLYESCARQIWSLQIKFRDYVLKPNSTLSDEG